MRKLSTSAPWVVTASCATCGTAFLTTTYDVAKGWGRFCSRQCRADVQNIAGASSPRWNGGRTMIPAGYIHAATGTAGGQLEHIVVAERALGRRLPDGAEVHHVNGDKADNRNANLVICQDAAYHGLLHVLARVRAGGGRPFLDRLCSICRQPKPLQQFSPTESRCKPCNAARVAAAKERAIA